MGNERQRVELLAQSDDEEGSKMKYRYEESTFLRSNELDVDAVFSIASGVVSLQGAEGERLCEWHYRDMGFGYRNYYAACNRAGTVMSESTDYCPKCGGKVVMLGEVAA